MCMGHGGGGGTPRWTYQKADGTPVLAELDIPQEFIERGATTQAQYQQMSQKDLADQQLAQQRTISDEQLGFNRQQLADQATQTAALKTQADDQAARQNTYDKGRADLLAEGTKQVNDAFGRFSPDYFQQYTNDYTTKATDDLNYQKALANKNLLFGLARQGLGASQAGVDQHGLIEEQAGRATAVQAQNALDATNALKSQVAGAKNSLLGQVQAAESISPPIAGVNDVAVNSALDTSRKAISGVANSAGDSIASLGGVPTVSSLGNIFAGVLGGVGSYLQGNDARIYGDTFNNTRNQGLGGSNPRGSGSTRTTGG